MQKTSRIFKFTIDGYTFYDLEKGYKSIIANREELERNLHRYPLEMSIGHCNRWVFSELDELDDFIHQFYEKLEEYRNRNSTLYTRSIYR